MERHPYFDLWLHDTPELEQHLGTEVVERTTIHDWPLSCVQLIHLSNGRRVIYKSQLRATSVEADFYTAINGNRSVPSDFAHARLPGFELVGVLENSIGMIFEYLDAPRLEDQQLAEAEIIEHGRGLLSELRCLPVNLPVYVDIGNQEKWSEYYEDTLFMLHALITAGKFTLTTHAAVQTLADWANSKPMLQVIHEPPAFTHGDLSGDNVFHTADGYKIIDWQRPVRGPAEMDLANFLFAMDVEPYPYLSRNVIELNWFLHLRWFVECKLRWFPVGESYDQQVADLASLILSSYGGNL
jgi:Phosphotransferase enzyme family